jgi:holo-[acyl-carrier protein] synthase
MATMNTLRIGIDVVSIDDVTTSLERFGERYVRRVFTEPESAYCREGAGRVAAERFAARFAAKEAAVKTLRPDGPWADWSAIEIHRHATGWCDLLLHREAAALAESQRIVSLALSLSHSTDYATAIVVAQTT